MYKCTDVELSEVLSLLRKDIPNCFYMYVDISKYGLSYPHLSVWLCRKEDELTAVVIKYFNSMQVYALPDAELREIAALIELENVPIVTGTAEVCDALSELLQGKYEVSHGWTFEIEKFRPFPSPFAIEKPSDEELPVCAKLICADSGIGGYYEWESLAGQLKERRDEGMGRNYVIRKDGGIIGHIATYAEFEEFAVTAGLIVEPENRDLPYGTYLESYLINELLSEGKRVFSFLREEKRVKYYRALGQKKFWRNGKLLRISGD